MREYFLFLCLIRFSSSCTCYFEETDSDLVCDSNSNVVKVRIDRIIKDIPDKDELNIMMAEEMLRYLESMGEVDEDQTSEPGHPFVDEVIDLSSWNDATEKVWLSSEIEVEAVVEKVWGLGGAKVGQRMKLTSHNNYDSCGVARFLKLGCTVVFRTEQDVTEKQLGLCDLIYFYPPGVEGYFDAMDTLVC
jgi:hypothetical protein